jgi:hypothetical protein
MEGAKMFKTRSGYCFITPDEIILTQQQHLQKKPAKPAGDLSTVVLSLYAIAAAFVFYFSVLGFQQADYYPAAVLLIVSVGIMAYVYTARNKSFAPIIPRESIRDIELIKAIPGGLGTHFNIWFEDDNGQLKRRVIKLPGMFVPENTELVNAIKIMQEEFGE